MQQELNNNCRKNYYKYVNFFKISLPDRVNFNEDFSIENIFNKDHQVLKDDTIQYPNEFHQSEMIVEIHDYNPLDY